jgi:hypothetical protein
MKNVQTVHEEKTMSRKIPKRDSSALHQHSPPFSMFLKV